MIGVRMGNFRPNCSDAGSDILLANLTIHCEAWNCTSPLNFTGIVNITRFIGCTEILQMYHAAWINGTVKIETEEQNGEEQHAPGDGVPGGSRGAGSASQSSPSPTSTPTEVAAAPTPTEAPTPTLASTSAPSAPPPTPTQTPSPTPATVPRVPPLFLMLIIIAVIVIAGVIIIVMRRK